MEEIEMVFFDKLIIFDVYFYRESQSSTDSNEPRVRLTCFLLEKGFTHYA